MHVLYARRPVEGAKTPSIFLAGPSPHSIEVESWRKEAIRLLSEASFSGTVFVPEDEDGKWDESFSYNEQIDWEHIALESASCIAFWIPRNMVTLPGFTTNVEFGMWMNSGKIVLGAPKDAPKMKYQWYYANRLNIPVAYTLNETLALALQVVGHV